MLGTARGVAKCSFIVLSCLQDPVPVVGKFGSMYARPGHRVLIDPKGNMSVRPTPLDLKLAQACKLRLRCHAHLRAPHHAVFTTYSPAAVALAW